MKEGLRGPFKTQGALEICVSSRRAKGSPKRAGLGRDHGPLAQASCPSGPPPLWTSVSSFGKGGRAGQWRGC